MAQIYGKQIKSGSIGADRLSFTVPAQTNPTKANKDMAALTTTADGQLATSGSLSFTPAGGSYVEVSVNGAEQNVGDGDKTHDCYFSTDSGATAVAFASLASGALLYWNGSIAGFQLAPTDSIDFDYEV